MEGNLARSTGSVRPPVEYIACITITIVIGFFQSLQFDDGSHQIPLLLVNILVYSIQNGLTFLAIAFIIHSALQIVWSVSVSKHANLHVNMIPCD